LYALIGFLILAIFIVVARGPGPQGLTGIEGPQGSQGPKGFQGSETINYGPSGATGALGPSGPPGIPGHQGSQGPAAQWIGASVEEVNNINLEPLVLLSEESGSTDVQKIYSLDFTLQGPRPLPGFTASCTSSQSPSNSVVVSKVVVTGPKGIVSETINFAFDLPTGPQGLQGNQGIPGQPGITTTGANGDRGDPNPNGPGPTGTGFESLTLGANNIRLLFQQTNKLGGIQFETDAGQTLNFNESTQTLETTVLSSPNYSSLGLNYAVPQLQYTMQSTAYMTTSHTGTIKIGTSPGESFLIHTFKAYTTCVFTLTMRDSVYGIFSNHISGVVYQNGPHGQGIKITNQINTPNPTSIIEDTQDNSTGNSVQIKFAQSSDSRWNNNYLNFFLILSPCMPFN